MFKPNRPPASLRLRTQIRNLRAIVVLRLILTATVRAAAVGGLSAGLVGLLANDRVGVVQLDRRARVLAANGPVLEIPRRGDGPTDRDGTLDAWLPADRRCLQRLPGRALPDLRATARSGGLVTVQRSSARWRLTLHVSPVSPGAADFSGRRVPRVLGGMTVTLSCDKSRAQVSAAGAKLTVDGTKVASFTGRSMTTPPPPNGATVNGNVLTLAFDQAPDASVAPPGGSFRVGTSHPGGAGVGTGNRCRVAVTEVSLSTTTTLTLSLPGFSQATAAMSCTQV